MKLNAFLCILLSVLLLLPACSGGDGGGSSAVAGESSLPGGASASPPGDEAVGKAPLYSVIYREPQSGYTVISSDLVDTLFIAGALYYEFESSNLCPAGFTQSYADVQQHFAPYQSHPFVQEFGKYANDMMQDVNGDAVSPLVYYILTGEGFDRWESYLFADAGEVNDFVAGLRQFYQDTGAEAFLRDSALRQQMLAYIPEAAAELPIAAYFEEMEAYVGNRALLFGGDTLHYTCLVTPFRPAMASFYDCYLGDEVYFVAQLAPYSFMDGTLDMRQVVETSIHESLHLFINDAVAGRADLIEALAQDLDPAGYTSQMYTYMPWHRIADEAVVRAVQGGIYRQVYGDSDRAYQELLVKEQNAGIANLDQMYDALQVYEGDRETYPTIDSYMDVLLEAYLNG